MVSEPWKKTSSKDCKTIHKSFQVKIPIQEKCINPPMNERVALDFAKKKKDFHRRMPKGLKYE